MKMKLFAVLVWEALMFGLTGTAHAVPVTINITAEVAYVHDMGGLLGGAISVGGILRGHYTYDTATLDSNPLETVGDYWHNSSPYGISISGGGFTFETDPLNTNFLVEMVNDHSGRDNYLLRSYNNQQLSNGTFVDHISWQLDDVTQSALSTVDLSAFPPNLSDWQSIFGLNITGSDTADPYLTPFSNQFSIRAHVTSAELMPVPEPATLLLLGTGIACLAGSRIRREKKYQT